MTLNNEHTRLSFDRMQAFDDRSLSSDEPALLKPKIERITETDSPDNWDPEKILVRHAVFLKCEPVDDFLVQTEETPSSGIDGIDYAISTVERDVDALDTEGAASSEESDSEDQSPDAIRTELQTFSAAAGGYCCQICQNVYPTFDELKTHTFVHAHPIPYYCDTCHMRFRKLADYDYHLHTHPRVEPFRRSRCKQVPASARRLSSGKRPNAREPQYSCELCDRKFRRLCELRSHARSHVVEKTYECHICLAKCVSEKQLKHHLKLHTNHEPFKCSKCEIKFSDARLYLNHMAEHSKPLRLECLECNLRFRAKKYLQQHMDIAH